MSEHNGSVPGSQNGNPVKNNFWGEYMRGVSRKSCTWLAMMAILSGVAAPVAAQTESTPLRLSLRQAVELALEPDGNNRIRLAAESVEQARAQSIQQRALLLPNVSGSVNQQSRTIEEALATALESRSDLATQREREERRREQ